MKKYTFLVLSFTFLSLMFDFDVQAMRPRRACRKATKAVTAKKATSTKKAPQQQTKPQKKANPHKRPHSDNSGYEADTSGFDCSCVVDDGPEPTCDEEVDPLNLFDKEAQMPTQPSKRGRLEDAPTSDEEKIHYNQQGYERVIRRDSDLVGANLQGAIFPNKINLSGIDLTNANLRGAKLRGAILNRTILEGADLTGADLTGATLIKTNLEKAILVNTNLSGATLDAVVWEDVYLVGSQPYSLSLVGATLQNLVFCTKHTIKNVNFSNSFFNHVYFNECKLDNIKMCDATVNGLVFDATDLNCIDFQDSTFYNLCIFNNKCLGRSLNFKNVKITESFFLGKKLTTTANLFCPGRVTPEIKHTKFNNGERCFFIATAPASALTFTLYNIINKVLYGQQFCITANSFIGESNFQGLKLEKVYFGFIVFLNCENLEHITSVNKSVFHHTEFSNTEIPRTDYFVTKKLQAKGAKINGDYDVEFKMFWENVSDPNLISMIGSTFVQATAAEAGRHFAGAGIAALAGLL